MAEENYQGTPKEVWDSLTTMQKHHFIKDHKTEFKPKPEYAMSNYADLPKNVQDSWAKHHKDGKYAKGKTIAKKSLSIVIYMKESPWHAKQTYRNAVKKIIEILPELGKFNTNFATMGGIDSHDITIGQFPDKWDFKKIHEVYYQIENLLSTNKNVESVNLKDGKNFIEGTSYAKGKTIDKKSFNSYSDSWFDAVAEQSPNFSAQSELVELIDITNKPATRKNLELFVEVVNKTAYFPETRTAITNHANAILNNDFKDEFKNQFGGTRDNIAKVSATSSFFDSFNQASTYEMAKGKTIDKKSFDNIKSLYDEYANMEGIAHETALKKISTKLKLSVKEVRAVVEEDSINEGLAKGKTIDVHKFSFRLDTLKKGKEDDKYTDNYLENGENMDMTIDEMISFVKKGGVKERQRLFVPDYVFVYPMEGKEFGWVQHSASTGESLGYDTGNEKKFRKIVRKELKESTYDFAKHGKTIVKKGHRLPHGYEVVKGADKNADYSQGKVQVKTGYRLPHGYVSVRGKKKDRVYELGKTIDAIEGFGHKATAIFDEATSVEQFYVDYGTENEKMIASVKHGGPSLDITMIDEESVMSVLSDLLHAHGNEQTITSTGKKALTQDEIDFIISATNRYGAKDVPTTNRINWERLTDSYIKEILTNESFCSNLSDKGVQVCESIKSKLNIN